MKELNDIIFNLKEVGKTDNSDEYHVEIKVPTSIGLIERMKFIVDSSNERRAFQLKHLKNENDLVYFETREKEKINLEEGFQKIFEDAYATVVEQNAKFELLRKKEKDKKKKKC